MEHIKALQNKKIGIWGFGKVGRSYLTFCAAQGISCTIYDQRPLTPDELALIKQRNATAAQHISLADFLSQQDIILASPGIDTNPYRNQAQFMCELDLFSEAWHKPYIGITGTLGKTTITTLLGQLLSKALPVAVGGNIGTPMLDLLPQQPNVDLAILELSSWQLEHTNACSPAIAIWTNLFANHLDRHQTMEAYLHAKARILTYQKPQEYLIAPFSLRDQILITGTQATCCWISTEDLTQQIALLGKNECAIYIRNDTIIRHTHNEQVALNSTNNLPKQGFLSNWLILLATLNRLKLPLALLSKDTACALPHRLEQIAASLPGIYINDSKSTTAASTLAAIGMYQHQPIMLIIGGLSKGIDRTELIAQLPPSIKKVFCFGKEAHELLRICTMHCKDAYAYDTLTEVMETLKTIVQENDIVLFSPSGASFDLYANYEERGNHFKLLALNN